MKSSLDLGEMDICPEKFSICSVIGRMLDGLKFRYYWATEGLKEEDYSYDPGNGGRNLHQTLSHIHKMVDFIGCIIEDRTSKFPEIDPRLSIPELRKETLDQIEEIRHLALALSDEELISRSIKVDFNGDLYEHSIWNLFNGPIPEAFYHLGQVVSFRRTLGNPIDPYVDPFVGKRFKPEE